jgi:uncharacterized protein (TIGR03086 family)
MSTAALEQAIESTRSVLAGVRQDQLGAATPCASWTVAALINHVVGGQFLFATLAAGGSPSGDAPPDFAAGDFVAAFDQGSAAAVSAFGADGVMETTMHLPFGDMPGSAFIGLAATDTFVHGWDLARATGQSSDLDPTLAVGLLAGIRPAISDAVRGADGEAPFGPVQAAPEGASNADQLAAFLGRTV